MFIDDARKWQVIDRGAWLEPMSASAVIEGLRRGSILSSARCREVGATEWQDVTKETAFARWVTWRRGGWVVFGLIYAVGSWSLWAIADASEAWQMRVAVAGSSALLLVVAMYRHRRRRALDPIAAAGERHMMRFALAVGMFMRCIDMITEILPPAIDGIRPMNALGAVAITVLACWLFWLQQRRDEPTAPHGMFAA